MARDLARKPSSVRKQVEAVFQSAARTGPWTASEVTDLKRYLGLAAPEVIATILGRKTDEVQRQIFELGRLRRKGAWTREERNKFKRLYGRRSDEDLALVFTRSVEAVQSLAAQLRLGKDKAYLKRNQPRATTPMPRWTPDALGELRARYPHDANIDIAQSLGRSVKSVVSKAHQLGLRKEVERLRQMGRENVRLRYGR